MLIRAIVFCFLSSLCLTLFLPDSVFQLTVVGLNGPSGNRAVTRVALGSNREQETVSTQCRSTAVGSAVEKPSRKFSVTFDLVQVATITVKKSCRIFNVTEI